MGIQINGNTNNINAGIGSLSIEDLNELHIVGVATATFPAEVTDAEIDGAIAYQWYRKLASESSFSALGAGSTFYSGQNSTTLSIDFALSPDFHSSEYYLEATYNPVGLGVTEGTAGDAFNEPIITSTATLSTNPGLAINVQPSDQTAVIDADATFTGDKPLFLGDLNADGYDDMILTMFPMGNNYNITTQVYLGLPN